MSKKSSGLWHIKYQIGCNFKREWQMVLVSKTHKKKKKMARCFGVKRRMDLYEIFRAFMRDP